MTLAGTRLNRIMRWRNVLNWEPDADRDEQRPLEANWDEPRPLEFNWDEMKPLDRNEPSLNTSIPGDARDATTPDAMMNDLKRLITGAQRYNQSAALVPLMLAFKTAENRIRAGLPKSWKCGNKTGTGSNGSTNDIAVIWPQHRKPIFMTVYYTESKLELPARESVIADVARIVSKTLV